MKNKHYYEIKRDGNGLWKYNVNIYRIIEVETEISNKYKSIIKRKGTQYISKGEMTEERILVSDYHSFSTLWGARRYVKSFITQIVDKGYFYSD